jgi:hypothetical protein
VKRAKVSPLLVVGLVLLALVGWGLYMSIEFYEESEESGWSREALFNPYLAAQQFMSGSDIGITDADSLARLDQLDQLEGLGTLFFSDDNQVSTPRQLRQVMDWLEQGGNVIYSANDIEHDEDLLLSEFAVEVELPERESDEDDTEKTLGETLREYNRQIENGKSREEVMREFGKPEQSLTRIRFDEDIGELEIAFNSSRILKHSGFDDDDDDDDSENGYQPFSWSNSEYGVHLMQFEVGAGLLTILSDPGIWTSYRIDQHDHAYLLWLLSSDEGNFAILHSILRDSVWELMLRHGRELLIVAGLLIATLLWRLGSRFGRLLPRDLSRRRALGEHFSSVSHYLWHRRRGEYLLTPLRQAVLRRASLSLGGFARAQPTRQYELIAERCKLDTRAIAQALNHQDFNETSFVQTVRLLKQIEQSL